MPCYLFISVSCVIFAWCSADPTADVEGHDVQAKIALLAKLAFGQDVPLDKIPCAGISKLTRADFACAKVMRNFIGSPIAPNRHLHDATLNMIPDLLLVLSSSVLLKAQLPLERTSYGSTFQFFIERIRSDHRTKPPIKKELCTEKSSKQLV